MGGRSVLDGATGRPKIFSDWEACNARTGEALRTPTTGLAASGLESSSRALKQFETRLRFALGEPERSARSGCTAPRAQSRERPPTYQGALRPRNRQSRSSGAAPASNHVTQRIQRPQRTTSRWSTVVLSVGTFDERPPSASPTDSRITPAARTISHGATE